MTLPIQEYHALCYSLQFLYELTNPSKTPDVPKKVRQRAMECLKHYPLPVKLEELYEEELKPARIPKRY